MKVEIVGFKNDVARVFYQGISGGRPYENVPVMGGYYNGAGAFNPYPEPLTFVQWRNSKNGKIEGQNIRDWLKQKSGGKRFTQKYLNLLTELNQGRQMEADWCEAENTRKLVNLEEILVPKNY